MSDANSPRLQQDDEQRAKRFEALARFAEPFKNERPEDIEREVAKAVAAARAELREEARWEEPRG